MGTGTCACLMVLLVSDRITVSVSLFAKKTFVEKPSMYYCVVHSNCVSKMLLLTFHGFQSNFAELLNILVQVCVQVWGPDLKGSRSHSVSICHSDKSCLDNSSCYYYWDVGQTKVSTEMEW